MLGYLDPPACCWGVLRLTASDNTWCMMFERASANRWRLTENARKQIGSVIIYLRNEWKLSADNMLDADYSNPSKQQQALAHNYYKMVECCDRILSRLNETFDAHRISYVFGAVCKAYSDPHDDNTQRLLKGIAESIYGTVRPDTGGDRVNSEGDDTMAGETGPAITRPQDSE